MRFPVRPELPTASVVRGLYIDHDRRRGQLCTFTNRPHGTYLSGYVCSDQPSHFYTLNNRFVMSRMITSSDC